jgi:TrmH family RNA methyltransferase
MLTSTRNPRIKRIRKLQNSARTRRNEGFFIAEGIRLLEEVYKTGWHCELLIYTQDLPARGKEMVSDFAATGVECTPVATHVMEAASDTKSPQGILGLLSMQALSLPKHPDFILIADEIRDPGNLGTILRIALAAGADGVVLAPGTVDPFSPKVVRAAMGAHFTLPMQQLSWDDIRRLVETKYLEGYLAAPTKATPYYEADFISPLAIIIGGEAAGAGIEASKLATQRVHIPMLPDVESLNAAVAAAVLLFEVVRQRQGSVSEDT